MQFSVAVELPPQTWTLAVSRRIVGMLLDRAAVSATIKDDLAVAVTEACSNVVRHAPADGLYRLAVDVDDDRCVIEVRDAGPGFDPNPPWSTPGNHSRGGRGLLLMDALVDDLRLERRQRGMTVTMIKNIGRRVDGGPPPRADGSLPAAS